MSTAFNGVVEGAPSTAQREAIIADTLQRRSNWTPPPEAWALLKRLETFIGAKVQLQYWCADMAWDEGDGPSPVTVTCTAIVTQHDDGFEQAYLVVTDVTEVVDAEGYSSSSFLKPIGDDLSWLAPINGLYRIFAIGGLAA